MQLSWVHVAPLVLASAGTAGFIVIGYLYYKERKGRDETSPKEAVTPVSDSRTDGIGPPCPDYTYDGVILYVEEDRQDVIDLTNNLLKYSTIQHLSLDGYDALPLAGKSNFDCMNYLLTHSRFIFVYVSPNFTQDNMVKFQAQMCLMDVIKKEEWRVIPVLEDRNYDTYCPSELKLLHGLEKWNISSSSSTINDYFQNKFDRLINDGRKRL